MYYVFCKIRLSKPLQIFTMCRHGSVNADGHHSSISTETFMHRLVYLEWNMPNLFYFSTKSHSMKYLSNWCQFCFSGPSSGIPLTLETLTVTRDVENLRLCQCQRKL